MLPPPFGTAPTVVTLNMFENKPARTDHAAPSPSQGHATARSGARKARDRASSARGPIFIARHQAQADLEIASARLQELLNKHQQPVA